MKKINTYFVIGMLVLSSAIMFSGCKKKSDPAPVAAPTFIVSGTTINQAGIDYLQFVAYCSTNDVKLTKVSIKDAMLNTYTYTANGDIWVQNELISFPDVYTKQFGVWTFTFVGNRTTDNSSFTSTATVTINGK